MNVYVSVHVELAVCNDRESGISVRSLRLRYMKAHRPWISLQLFSTGKVHNDDLAGWVKPITDLSSASRGHKTTHRPAAIANAPWWPKAVKAAQQGVFIHIV